MARTRKQDRDRKRRERAGLYAQGLTARGTPRRRHAPFGSRAWRLGRAAPKQPPQQP